MSISPETILSILKKVAQEGQNDAAARLRPKLNERETRLLDWVLSEYEDENKKRWYDPYHILFSTDFAVALTQAEELDRLVVSAIILHDIGYFALTDKGQWGKWASRVTHMQEGAALAARVLAENGFSPEELEKVLGMIAVHDNPYIGLPIYGRDRLALRDCDRIYVMHPLGVYKDLISEAEGNASYKEFLHDRITQFYGWRQPFGDRWLVDTERVIRNSARIEMPTYPFTQAQVKRQFERRLQELNGNLLDDAEKFETHLRAQVEREWAEAPLADRSN